MIFLLIPLQNNLDYFEQITPALTLNLKTTAKGIFSYKKHAATLASRSIYSFQIYYINLQDDTD